MPVLFSFVSTKIFARQIALPLAAAGMFAVAVTTGFTVGASWYDEQRVLCLVVLFGLALLHLRFLAPWPRESRHEARPQSILPVVAALMLGCASAAAAARPDAAWAEWSAVALVVAAALALSRNAGSARNAAIMFAALPASAYSFGVLARYGSAWATGMPLGTDTFLVGFANPRFAGQLQALTIPLLPMAWLCVPARWRWAVSLIGVAWWMCLLGSGSRTAWLALAVATAVVLPLGAAGRRWCQQQAGWAVGGGVVFWLLFVLLPDIAGTVATIVTRRPTGIHRPCGRRSIRNPQPTQPVLRRAFTEKWSRKSNRPA